MPMFSCNRPSLQLARVQASLANLSVPSQSFYFNVQFASEVGVSFYNDICNNSDILLGHWMFSAALPELKSSAQKASKFLDKYFDRLIAGAADEHERRERLLNIQSTVAPSFIHRCAQSNDWSPFKWIGFTCTFSQLIPSLALANAIKARHPQVKIVLGGAEVQGPMGREVFRKCSFVDFIVDGEGEEAIAQVFSEPKRGIIKGASPNLDLLPPPNYDEYFRLIENSDDPDLQKNAYVIPIEGSRGCWWGQKHHCTFCGLNGEDLRFRSRAPDSILGEIDTLSNAYERYEFEFVDNILDYKHFSTLLPRLKELRGDLTFFAETKSNLSKDQLILLTQSGFSCIQPGIESLSSKVLKIMKKGVLASQNLELLKQASDLRMRIIWNLLFGFPGEDEADVRNMIELMKRLFHLEPPQGSGRIRLDRFSPYHTEIKDQKSPQFDDVRPAEAYGLIYPDDWNLWDLAYFFEGKGRNSVPEETYQELMQLVTDWKEAWAKETKPSLVFKRSVSSGHVIDNRTGEPEVYRLEDDSYRLAVALSVKSSSAETLARDLNIDIEKTTEILAEFNQIGICVELDSKFVYLPNIDPSQRLNFSGSR